MSKKVSFNRYLQQNQIDLFYSIKKDTGTFNLKKILL